MKIKRSQGPPDRSNDVSVRLGVNEDLHPGVPAFQSGGRGAQVVRPDLEVLGLGHLAGVVPRIEIGEIAAQVITTLARGRGVQGGVVLQEVRWDRVGNRVARLEVTHGKFLREEDDETLKG